MRLLFPIGLLLFAVGCQTMPTGETVFAATLTNKQKLELLDAEAKKRNLRYRVFCTSTYKDEEEEYLAVAEHREATPGAIYVDQGRMDEWMEASSTQIGAAWELYHSIQGPPTHRAAKWFVRENGNAREPRQCPPEIRGND